MYDVETGLYYLVTRYYDPQIGRFISADDIRYLEPSSINGLNLYSYCGNNPIMNVDPNGNLFFSVGILLGCMLAGAIAGGIMGGVSAAVSNRDIASGIFLGALGGALLAATGYIAGAAVVAGLLTKGVATGVVFGTGFVTGFANESAQQLINNEQYDFWKATKSGLYTGVTSALALDIAGFVNLPINSGGNAVIEMFTGINFGAATLIMEGITSSFNRIFKWLEDTQKNEKRKNHTILPLLAF